MTTKRVVVVYPDLGVGGGGGGAERAERLTVDASKNTESVETDKNNKLLVNGDEAAAVHRGFQTMLEGDLYCAICREIYINPQILNCAHSFCKFCLDEWLSKKYGCPSCRMVVVFQTENLALKNIINKMVSTSSKEFQNERDAALDQRSKAESQQKTNGVQPRMEHRSFFSDGRAKPTLSRNHIRPWRGPNGATIWQTKVDKTGKVIAVDTENFSSSSEEDDDNDDEDDDDDDNDGDVEIYDNDYFSNGSDSDISYAHEYMPGAEFIDLDDADEDDEIEVMESSDESATSTVNMDSSSDDDNNSYVAARRRRMNDLNILAGNIDADDDESWEPRADRSSDSMEAVETESEEESGLEIFGMLARAPILDSTDSDTSSESNSDDDDDEDPVPIEFEETTEDEDDSTSESCDHDDDNNDDDSELY